MVDIFGGLPIIELRALSIQHLILIFPLVSQQDSSATVLTDDVSLQGFMDHLKKLAVSSSA